MSLAVLGRSGWIFLLALSAAGCRLPYIPYVTLPAPAAVAHLVDGKGQAVGIAVLTQDNGSVRLLLDVTGLPEGTRAVHIHEVGRCDPPSFDSAGGHFNPTKAEHGTANPRGPHVGDLPDITISTEGTGHLEFTVKRATLARKAAGSLLDADGSAIVIHERADDKRTDPAGESGARIACGVIVGEGKR